MTRRTTCPIHHGNNHTAFWLDPATGNWACFTHKCHETHGADIIGLIRSVKGLTYQEACEYITKLLSVELEKYSIEDVENFKFIKSHKFKPVVQGVVPCTLDRQPCEYLEYFAKNDISPETCKKFEVCKLLKYPNRFALPIYNQGVCVGYTCRKIQDTEDNFPKWLHVPKGVVIQQTFFGMQHFKNINDTVILVEGPADTMKLHQCGFPNALGILGLELTKEKIQKLLKMRIKHIMLMMDPDEAGKACSTKMLSEKGIGMYFNVTNLTNVISKEPSELSERELKDYLKCEKN